MKNTVYYFIILYTLLYSKTSCTQNTDYLVDSSYQYISEKYYEYKFIDTLKSRKLAEIFLKKAEKEKDTFNIIDGYYFLSEVYHMDSIFINYLDSVINFTKLKPTKMFPSFAYLEKGWFNVINGRNNKSLKNYLLAIKHAEIIKNDSLKYIAKQRIGFLKSRNNQSDKAKSIYKEVYHFYNKHPKYRNDLDYNSLLSNISYTYLKEKKYDSAIFFNNKAIQLAKKNKNIPLLGYTFYRKGQIEFNQEKYVIAIDNLKKSFIGIIDDENYNVLSASYNLIAKSYSKLNNHKEALKYNFLIDSLYQKTNITHPSQRSSYNFLINHYKEKKDLKNQLKYIEKFLKVDRILNAREKKLTKTFIEEYDTPMLLKEKEHIIQKLEGNLISSNKTSLVLGTLAIFSSFLFCYQYKKKKILKCRFDVFIKKQKNNSKKVSKPEKIASNEINIPKDIVISILDKLNTFEERKGFTSVDITLNSLAKELDTNTNYLSKIVNCHEGVGFSKYLSELRVKHALYLINKNTFIRKYTIKAIANEVGFKTAESFSNAFYRKTGLKPSYYIKQVNKLEAA